MNGLHSGNSVTISESAISSQLPPGKYHYSLFEHIDIFKHPDEQKKNENLPERIQKLEKDVEYHYKELERTEERASFAQELIREILYIIEHESRATEMRKRIQRAYDDSYVEL